MDDPGADGAAGSGAAAMGRPHGPDTTLQSAAATHLHGLTEAHPHLEAHLQELQLAHGDAWLVRWRAQREERQLSDQPPLPLRRRLGGPVRASEYASHNALMAYSVMQGSQ